MTDKTIRLSDDDLIRRGDAKAELERHAKGTTTIGGQTFRTIQLCEAVDAIAALPAVTPGVKPLEWSEHTPPNEVCSYDHVFAETAIGRYSIEWKGWKVHDTFDVFLNGEWVESAHDLEAAKQKALAHLKGIVESLLTSIPAVTPGVRVKTEALEAIAAICAEDDPFIGIGKSADDKAVRILAALDLTPQPAPAMRPETDMEHIARDMRDGRFPERSQRQMVPVDPQPAPDVARLVEADPAVAFDKADWFWRTMDPDDCGDTPNEAINRGMVGLFCVCEVASSYSGPIRYGFLAPVLDPDSDDEEFVHFATQQEAIDAAKDRAALAAMEGKP